MKNLLIAALGLLVSLSLAAQTCEEKESEAVFSVLPSCGAGCASVSAICSASGVPEPDCSLCITGLVTDGRALECASGMYCWQEHQIAAQTGSIFPFLLREPSMQVDVCHSWEEAPRK
jgi:hypothetical protein